MKNTKRFLGALALATLFTLAASAQSNERKGLYYAGFSGGMMVHTGYIAGGKLNVVDNSGQTIHYNGNIAGAPTGVGGAAKIHLGNHLRVGFEGYVSTLNYGQGRGSMRNQSHARVGWGGLLADYKWTLREKWRPYAGMTVGGGSYKNLTLFGATPVDNKVEGKTENGVFTPGASYRNYSFVLAAPFAGIEFALSDRIGLNVKADWMVKLTNRQPDFATGPRIYFGFTFYRFKD